MPAAQVLDSHALLAYFRQETGGERVKELLHKAATADRPLHMTEVNYAEVNYMIRKCRRRFKTGFLAGSKLDTWLQAEVA